MAALMMNTEKGICLTVDKSNLEKVLSLEFGISWVSSCGGNSIKGGQHFESTGADPVIWVWGSPIFEKGIKYLSNSLKMVEIYMFFLNIYPYP